MVWLTDDVVQAQPLPLQDPVLQENCYVLYCTRCQVSHREEPAGTLSTAKNGG